MRRRREIARAKKQEGKHTTKSIFQPQQARLEFAVAGAPNADLIVMTLSVKLPESPQLIDLGIAALDFALQGRAKLVHLAVILRREDSFLLGQLVIKLQLQRRLRPSNFHQLSFQLLTPTA
jgi:hypothetical protein